MRYLGIECSNAQIPKRLHKAHIEVKKQSVVCSISWEATWNDETALQGEKVHQNLCQIVTSSTVQDVLDDIQNFLSFLEVLADICGGGKVCAPFHGKVSFFDKVVCYFFLKSGAIFPNF